MPYSDPEKRREYQARWVAARREEWFRSQGACIDCGSLQDLRLDHVDPATKVSHRVWSWSQERRDAELSKCVVRCEPCHKKKTRVNRETLGRAVITFEQAQEIRERYAAESITQKALGSEYGLAQQSVSDILSGTHWVDFEGL